MKALLTFLLVISLSACAGAVGSSFKPKTVAGAQCKNQCAQNMSRCLGSSYTCDRAASTCMQSCEELDAVSKR